MEERAVVDASSTAHHRYKQLRAVKRLFSVNVSLNSHFTGMILAVKERAIVEHDVHVIALGCIDFPVQAIDCFSRLLDNRRMNSIMLCDCGCKRNEKSEHYHNTNHLEDRTKEGYKPSLILAEAHASYFSS